MLRDITFGQYFPAKSVLHAMDARVKLVLTVAMIVLLFVAGNAVSILLTLASVVALMAASRIPARMYLKSLKPIIPIIILTSLLNALYIQGGAELFSFWIFTVTSRGVLTAVYMSLRIAMLILCSAMLTYSTSPTELTDAIERLCSPLKVFHLDVHLLAMMMTIALRFIPTLLEETDRIMSAQKARGADLESGGLLQRIRALMPVLIPLLVSSFRRAGELADAMECRCYHGGKGRTRMKQMHMRASDFVSIAVVAVLFAGVILSNIYLDGFLLGLVYP